MAPRGASIIPFRAIVVKVRKSVRSLFYYIPIKTRPPGALSKVPQTVREEPGAVRRAISGLLPETSHRLFGAPGEHGDSGYAPSFDQWGQTSASSAVEPVKGDALGDIRGHRVVACPVMNSARKKIGFLSRSGEAISGLRGLSHHAVLVNNSEHFDPNEN